MHAILNCAFLCAESSDTMKISTILIKFIPFHLQVQLIPYNPDILDESILWTESADLGDGFRTVRMVNNIRLNLDAFHGDKKSGGVHDGTIIVLWNKNKGDNQRWKIVPYCKFSTYNEEDQTIYLQSSHYVQFHILTCQ